MKFRKRIVFLVSLFVLFLLVSCAGENVAMDNESGGNRKEENVLEGESGSDLSRSSVLSENRKLIQTVNIRTETENLDATIQSLEKQLVELGGYTENSNLYNGSAYQGTRYRNLSLTVRIPAEKLDAFLNQVGDVTNVVSSQKTVEDVTLNYVATESRMKALQTEEARLLELMMQAASLDEVLTVEKRLTDVRTELEKVTSSLKVFDNQVDYATVYLNIDEVKEFTDTTDKTGIGDRIKTGFMENLRFVGTFFQDLFVFLIVTIPILIPLGLGIFAVIFLLRRKNRKGKSNSKDNK